MSMTASGSDWAERSGPVDRYSRIVGLLKVILPLAALALLSTVFLLSRSINPEATIPFAEEDIAARTRDQQVTEPFFSGVTRGGEEIMVAAGTMRPGAPGKPAEARDLRARIRLVGGREILLDSSLGSLDPARDLAVFTGEVIVRTSDGMTLKTQRLEAALSGLAGEAPGEVSGTGPMGELTAGAMLIESENERGNVHILFTGGVKLLYDPKKSER